jgi:hypothetical protein
MAWVSVKNLMRHTSLNTTTLYTRTVTERMKEAVHNLGKPLEATLGGKWRQLPAQKNPKRHDECPADEIGKGPRCKRKR